MSAEASVANAILQGLGYAVFIHETSGSLRLSEGAPEWLRVLWPEVARGQDSLDSGVSPFLENFLIDAEECWRIGGENRARSGPWIEVDADGESVQLEATALTANRESILLLERLGDVFETRKALLQKARENVIAYQRLNSEIQKKEILLHCVAEDMSAALGNIVTSLRLLELENSSPKGRQLLALANRATEEQRTLIQKVLAVFAEELEGLFGIDDTSEDNAEIFTAIAAAAERCAPQLGPKNIRLTSPKTLGRDLRVPLAPRQLERVISNLLENAIERVASGGEISIRLDDEIESVALGVQDNGEAVSEEACADLFSKLEPSAGLPQGSALRLHFCRMIAESCGGEIGCETRSGNGNRFWIRLPTMAK